MTRKQETWMAIIVVTIIITLLFLSSCSTRRVVTEYVTVHDTLTVHKRDTIKDVVYKTHTDTVTNKEVHTYTLNNVGDTVREIHHYHDTEKVIIVDSTDRYRTKLDSLQRAINLSKDKETIKTKTTGTLWSKILFLVTIFAVCILVLKSRAK